MALTFDFCSSIFAHSGLSLSASAFDQLSQYAALLIDESTRQNVTAVRTEEEIWRRHFLDSAYLLRYLPAGKIIDIGTGGGIPGIPLAILNPSLQVTLLDSELRKIEFCRSVINNLGLHADAICGRAEELARDPKYAAQFDFAVSRAMAAGSMLSEISVPFLKIGGALFAMKGRQYDPAAERFAEAAAALNCTCERIEPYALDGEQKHLIVIRKDVPTPPQYPRRFAKIKRTPL